MPGDQPLSMTLTRYREPDWLLREALESLARQRNVKGDVLFLDQSPSNDLRIACQDLSSDRIDFVYLEIEAKGLSHARNEAIGLCRNEILLYLDSDAVAAPDWAAELGRSLSRPDVAVAGGRILPRWHSRPLLASRSRLVWEQYSLLDLGPGERDVHKIVGASFGLNISRLCDQAVFRTDLGRRDGRLFGGEETDLCRRASASGHRVIYNGDAVIEHQILPERISYRWLVKRFYFAGLNRARFGGSPDPTHGMKAWDLALMPLVLPPYATGYLTGRVT